MHGCPPPVQPPRYTVTRGLCILVFFLPKKHDHHSTQNGMPETPSNDDTAETPPLLRTSDVKEEVVPQDVSEEGSNAGDAQGSLPATPTSPKIPKTPTSAPAISRTASKLSQSQRSTPDSPAVGSHPATPSSIPPPDPFHDIVRIETHKRNHILRVSEDLLSPDTTLGYILRLPFSEVQSFIHPDANPAEDPMYPFLHATPWEEEAFARATLVYSYAEAYMYTLPPHVFDVACLGGVVEEVEEEEEEEEGVSEEDLVAYSTALIAAGVCGVMGCVEFYAERSLLHRAIAEERKMLADERTALEAAAKTMKEQQIAAETSIKALHEEMRTTAETTVAQLEVRQRELSVESDRINVEKQKMDAEQQFRYETLQQATEVRRMEEAAWTAVREERRKHEQEACALHDELRILRLSHEKMAKEAADGRRGLIWEREENARKYLDSEIASLEKRIRDSDAANAEQAATLKVDIPNPQPASPPPRRLVGFSGDIGNVSHMASHLIAVEEDTLDIVRSIEASIAGSTYPAWIRPSLMRASPQPYRRGSPMGGGVGGIGVARASPRSQSPKKYPSSLPSRRSSKGYPTPPPYGSPRPLRYGC